jgi:hypothetical protein
MHLIFLGSISKLSAVLSRVAAKAQLFTEAQLVVLPCPIDRPHQQPDRTS